MKDTEKDFPVLAISGYMPWLPDNTPKPTGLGARLPDRTFTSAHNTHNPHKRQFRKPLEHWKWNVTAGKWELVL